MTDQTSERAFESAVELMLVGGGWHQGDLAEWDVERAVFPSRVVAFLQAGQPELWEQLAGCPACKNATTREGNTARSTSHSARSP